ncbi:MAG: hypothetical protein K6E49_06315 [Lachnospiraceae bacterium]|nr:hypothetical protein [Lachnospiraceae bacterium]
MTPLQSFVTAYLKELTGAYYIKQVAVILVLFLLGAVFTDLLLGPEEVRIKRAVIAFPAGISVFVITAYVMLICGISYNTLTVSLVIAAEFAAALIAGRRKFPGYIKEKGVKRMLPFICFAAVLAMIATSGIAPVSVTNDTMYYFKRYPDCIVYYNGLRDQFDFFLTDTGLGVISLDTLPALFGFGYSFGIREFFHIDFLIFFGICVFERADTFLKKKSHALAAAIITTAFLAFSTPFVILGHWALANMYFMEMFFMAAYIATDYTDGGRMITPLLLLAMSLFRIEGTIFAVWLILCISLFTDLSKRLVLFALIPMAVLFGGYCLKIFTQFYVLDNVYLFMSPQKSAVLVAFIVAAGIYLWFVFPALRSKFGKYLPSVYLLALLAGNLLLFVSDSAHYTGNLSAFCSNLFKQSGWGMLPYFIIAMTVLLAAEALISRIRSRRPGDISQVPDVTKKYDMVLTVGFILIVLAASFGRGDVLSQAVGDSGNRVLLQVVPLLVMTYAELFLAYIARD